MEWIRKIWDTIKMIWFNLTCADDLSSCEKRVAALIEEVNYFSKLLNEEAKKNQKLIENLEDYKRKFSELETDVAILLDEQQQLKQDLEDYQAIVKLVGEDVINELIKRSNLLKK